MVCAAPKRLLHTARAAEPRHIVAGVRFHWSREEKIFFVPEIMTRVGTTGKNSDKCMTWPLEKHLHTVSHRLTYTSLSVRSGGLRLTLAGWWATHISATVHFYMATPLCSTRYGTKMCDCECVTAFDLWTAPASTQLSAVVVYQILTLMLNWGLLSLYCECFLGSSSLFS